MDKTRKDLLFALAALVAFFGIAVIAGIIFVSKKLDHDVFPARVFAGAVFGFFVAYLLFVVVVRLTNFIRRSKHREVLPPQDSSR